MSTVSSRDLRNHTADVLKRAEGGDRITVTVNGRPVAEIGPPAKAKPRFMSSRALGRSLSENAPDPDFARDIAALTSDTTDDLGPIE